MPVIPVTQEVEVEKRGLRQSQAKIIRPYLKDKLNQKGLRVWLKW
jgi:hypothetical protein